MELEQKLEQPAISTTNLQLAKLQRDAIQRAEYYYKGFGTTLGGILDNALLYSINGKKELMEKAYQWFKEMEDFYSKIPDTLMDNEAFFPLFETKKLLPKFQEFMDKLFKEKQKEALQELKNIADSLRDNSMPYSIAFIQLLQQIRLFPEAK